MPGLLNIKGTCYTCIRRGKEGIDEASGKSIIWCMRKNTITAPEHGCEYYGGEITNIRNVFPVKNEPYK